MSHDDALDALIATAKAHDVPPEGAEEQAWAALAGSLGGGGGGGGADAPLGAAGTAAAGAKLSLAIKAVAAVAVASAVAVGVASSSGPAPAASASVDPRPAAAPPEVEPQAAPPAPVVTVPGPPPSPPASPEPTEPAPRSAVAPAPGKPEPAPSTPSPSTLAQEARSVGAMWKALDRGDAEQALALAKSHRTRFRGGALDLEARSAALAARCVLHRPVDLRELESVQTAATRSVAKRVSSACAKKP